MTFEDTHACELVNKLGKLVSDELKTSLQNIILLGGLKCIHEHSHVTVE